MGTCCIPTCIATHACVIPASTHDFTRELPGLKGVGDGRGVSTSICLRVVAVCLWNVKNLKRKSQRVRDTDLYPFNVSIIIGNEKKPTKSRVYHCRVSTISPQTTCMLFSGFRGFVNALADGQTSMQINNLVTSPEEGGVQGTELRTFTGTLQLWCSAPCRRAPAARCSAPKLGREDASRAVGSFPSSDRYGIFDKVVLDVNLPAPCNHTPVIKANADHFEARSFFLVSILAQMLKIGSGKQVRAVLRL